MPTPVPRLPLPSTQARENEEIKAAAKARDDEWLAKRQSMLAAEWRREQDKLAALRQSKLDRGTELRAVISSHAESKERAAAERLAADREMLETRAKVGRGRSRH